MSTSCTNVVRKDTHLQWESDTIADIRAMGKNWGIRVNDRCFNLGDCRTYRCTAVADTTSTWTVCAGSLPVSSGTGSILVADGSGDWTEETDVTVDSAGLISTTGGVCLDDSDLCFSVSAVDRITAGFDAGDNWQITAFDSGSVQTAQLTIDTANGTLDFDGAVTVASLDIGGGASDAHVDADDFVVGTLSTQDAGMSVLFEPTTGQGWYAFTEVSGVMAADIHYDGASNELRSRVGGTQVYALTASLMAITPNITASGNITQDAGTSITNTMEVGATGTGGWYVDDGTNAQDGGVRYAATSNSLEFRANNADKLYLTTSQFYSASDNAISLGIAARRWSTVASYAGDYAGNVTVAGTLDASGLTYPTSDGGSGDIMSTNGAGTLSLVTLASLGLPDTGSTTNSTLRWSGTQWVENTALLATSAGAVTASSNLILSSTSAIMRHGDGVTTGAPEIRTLKGPTGTGYHYFFDTDETASADDFVIAHTLSPDLRISYYDGTAFRSTVAVGNDRNVYLLTESQGTSTLWLGNASNTMWTYEGLSGGDVTRIRGKSATGTSSVYMRSVFNADTTGDFLEQHTSAEAWALSRYDGVAHRQVLACTDDTDFTIGGGAQSSHTTSLGSTSFATADEANILLRSGATGLPTLQFTDSGNRIRWDEGANRLAFLVNNSEEVRIDASTLTGYGDLTLDSASPTATLGDGSGGPVLRVIKEDLSAAYQYWFKDDTTSSLDDFRWAYDGSENLVLQTHDGTDYRNLVTHYSSGNTVIHEGAQSSSTLSLGNSSFGATDEANLLLRGGTSGRPQMRFVDSGNYISFREDLQDFHSLIGGVEYVVWGQGSNVLLLPSASLTAPFVTVGSDSLGATDEARLLLRGGTSGSPDIDFIDTGNVFRFSEANQYYQHIIASSEVWRQSTTEATGYGDLTLDSDDPILTIGDGSGSPKIKFLKDGVGADASEIDWYSDTGASAGDWITKHETNDELRHYYYDGVGFRATAIYTDDATISFMGNAQSASTLTVGGSGQSTTQQIGIGGANTTTAILELVSGSTAGGGTAVDFFTGDTTVGDGDYRILQVTTGNMSLSRHDGTDYRNLLLFTDDTDGTIMGGAQASATVSIGNSGFATGDEANVLLHGGATSTPELRFIDSGNAIRWSESASQYHVYINSTHELTIDATAVHPAGTAKTLGYTTVGWKSLLLTDGISAPGTPSSTIVQYKDSADDVTKIKHSSGNVSTIAHDADSEVVAIFERATTDLERSNTSAESSYFSYSIPASALGANGVLECFFLGDVVNGVGDGSPLTVTIIIKLGTTVLFEDDTLTFADTAATSPRIPFTIKFWMANQNSESDQTGGAEVIFGKGSNATTGTGNLASAAGEIVQTVMFTDGAVDTSSAQTIDIRMTMDMASTSVRLRRRMAHLKISKAS